jgi:molecular chaperone GrpE (heat shock protein)
VSRNRPGPPRGRDSQPPPWAPELQKSLAEVAKCVPQINLAIEEVAEDNVALARSVRSVSDGQETLRTALCRELDSLRADVTGELQSQALKGYCRELTPVLSAIERMLSDVDLLTVDTTRQHLESLATTFRAALHRMGIERMTVNAGVDPFDSLVHDCVRTCTPEDSPVPDAGHGIVVHVQEPGYAIRGRVVQAARVWVQLRREAPSGHAEGEGESCDTTES